MLNIFLKKRYDFICDSDNNIINEKSFPKKLYKLLFEISNGLKNISFFGENNICKIKKKKNKGIKHGTYCLVMPIVFESNHDLLDYLERKKMVIKLFCDKYSNSIFKTEKYFSLNEYIESFNHDYNIFGEFIPTVYEYGYLYNYDKILCSYILMKEYYTFNNLFGLDIKTRIIFAQKIIDFYILLKKNKILIRDFKIENIGFDIIRDNKYIKIIDYDKNTFVYNNDDYVYNCIKDEYEEIIYILSRLTGFYYIPYYLIINYKKFGLTHINHNYCLNMDRVSLGIVLYQIISLDKDAYYKFYRDVIHQIKINKNLSFQEIKNLYNSFNDYLFSNIINIENEIIYSEENIFNFFLKIKFLIDDCLTPFSFPVSYYSFEDPEMNDVLQEYYYLSDDDGLY